MQNEPPLGGFRKRRLGCGQLTRTFRFEGLRGIVFFGVNRTLVRILKRLWNTGHVLLRMGRVRLAFGRYIVFLKFEIFFAWHRFTWKGFVGAGSACC